MAGIDQEAFNKVMAGFKYRIEDRLWGLPLGLMEIDSYELFRYFFLQYWLDSPFKESSMRLLHMPLRNLGKQIDLRTFLIFLANRRLNPTTPLEVLELEATLRMKETGLLLFLGAESLSVDCYRFIFKRPFLRRNLILVTVDSTKVYQQFALALGEEISVAG